MEPSKRRQGRPPIHGMAGKPEYKAWAHLRHACNNPRNPAYPKTGAVGVGYCAAFDTFEGFMEAMGPRPKGAKLRRKDVRADYTPDNCYWSSRDGNETV